MVFAKLWWARVKPALSKLHSDRNGGVPGLKERAAHVANFMGDRLAEHWSYIRRHGEDMPEVHERKWGDAARQLNR